MMMLLVAEQGYHSYGMLANSNCTRVWWLTVPGMLAFTKILGMDPKEADKLCRDAVAATKNKNLHSYAHQ
jgi:hypothetical protein